jgi:mandelate racemase
VSARSWCRSIRRSEPRAVKSRRRRSCCSETRGGPTCRAYVFTYTPLVLRPVADLVRSLASLVQGEPASPVDVDAALRARFRLLGDDGLVAIALAALDIALLDIRAKAAGLPLAMLLGGSIRPTRAYLSANMGGGANAEAQARRAIERGFRALKIKIGYPTLEEDVEGSAPRWRSSMGAQS